MLIRLLNPTGTIATLTEVRDACRVLDSSEDDRLLDLLVSQTGRYEHFTGRVMLPTDFELRISGWRDPILLPAAPIREVDEVAYLAPDHSEQALSPALWYLEDRGDGAKALSFVEDADLPSLSTRREPVIVRFSAGYEAPEDVTAATPAELMPVTADKTGVLSMVRRVFDTDEAMTDREMRERMGHRRRLA